MKREKEWSGTEISIGNWQQLQVFLEQLQLKGYSQNTLKTYRNEFMRLLKKIGSYPVEKLTQEQLRRYFLYCHNEEKLQENTIHSRINAVKFYFEQVLGRDTLFFNIPRPKKPLNLTRFFNQAEIITILKSAGNLKHRAMLMLAYSAGLRVSEVIKLKTRNIDSQRMCILLEAAKGKKDRMVMLSPVLLIMLREYWKKYHPRKDGYLFEGQTPGSPYSARSLQLVLQAAKKRQV